MKLSKQQEEKLCLAALVFGFTDEQLDAIYHDAPMTQELYDSILERCDKLGPGANMILHRMMVEFPELLEVNVQKIYKECGIED